MKSDIYSFGIILFELITAIHPHKNLMEYINLVSLFLFIATSSVSNNDNGAWIVSLYVQYCIEICNMYRTFKSVYIFTKCASDAFFISRFIPWIMSGWLQNQAIIDVIVVVVLLVS